MNTWYYSITLKVYHNYKIEKYSENIAIRNAFLYKRGLLIKYLCHFRDTLCFDNVCKNMKKVVVFFCGAPSWNMYS